MHPATRTAIYRRLRAANPAPTTELEYGSPFELLVAVVLSLLRRYANTSTTIVTHATLDVIALGVSSWLVYPLTIAMTVVLGGVAVLALRRSRGEPGRPIPSSEPAPL